MKPLRLTRDAPKVRIPEMDSNEDCFHAISPCAGMRCKYCEYLCVRKDAYRDGMRGLFFGRDPRRKTDEISGRKWWPTRPSAKFRNA